MLTVVEKVIFLQDIDVFQPIPTSDLAHLAAITEQLNFSKSSILFKKGDISDSMYMVIEGKVRLHRDGAEVMVAGYKEVFGTWALFDDEPRMVTAEAIEDTTVLRIDKEDFIDLLADHVEITQGILKAVVQRLRTLVAVVERDARTRGA